MTELVIVGDEAYLPEEWEREERRREAHNTSKRRYYASHREQRRAYIREWRRTNPDKVADYKRRHRAKLARTRVPRPVRVGALHSLACWGPHRHPRKHCKPIPMYAQRRQDAA